MAIAHTTGGEATGNAFFEAHEKYVTEMHQKINDSNDNLIMLLGPRRIGKTTVVKQYFLERNDDENDSGAYIYIYVDKVPNLFEYYRAIMKSIKTFLKAHGSKKKFLFMTFSSTSHKLLNGALNRIKKINFGEIGGLELSSPERWKEYLQELETIKGEFVSLLNEICKEVNGNIVLGLDEIPETIQHLLRTNGEEGAKEIEILLEHLRSIRKESVIKDNLNMILFGSVNMKLILENLGQTAAINDKFILTIEPLYYEEAQTLFWDLVDTLEYELLESHKDQVNEFIERKFTNCTPWAIQHYLNIINPTKITRAITQKTKKLEGEEKVKKEAEVLSAKLEEAYLELFDVVGGVRYLFERLGTYYQGNINDLKKALKILSDIHIVENRESIEDKEFSDRMGVDGQTYDDVVDILLLDNMIQREGTGYCMSNTVECHFWNHKLRNKEKKEE